MSENQFFDLSNLVKLENIGGGAFGTVFKVKDKKTGMYFAVKEFKINDDTETAYISREITIISKLKHPSILKFIGYSPIDFDNQSRPIIITEFSENNSLYNILDLERHSLAPLEWNKTKKLICIYGIASGMSYLHSHNIIHRDLKPQNILIDKSLFPKIGDFGISKILHQNSESMSFQSEDGIKGTANYIAPEIWSDFLYTPASDVYAFGMIVYEIMTLQIPFQKVPPIKLLQKISKGQRPLFNRPIERPYENLIVRCWSQKPKDRPTFDQIVEEIQNNKDFITADMNEGEFINYIDDMSEEIIDFNSKKRIDLDKIKLEEMKEKEEHDQITSEKMKIKSEKDNEEHDQIKSEKIKIKEEEDNEDHEQIKSEKMKTIKDNEKHDQITSEKINEKADEKADQSPLTNFFSSFLNLFTKEKQPVNFFPNDIYLLLDENCKNLVNEASTDKFKQFIVGKSLIEGTNQFPFDTTIGMKYLEISASSGCTDSAIYVYKLLTEGKEIPKDINKAKDILYKNLKSNDSRILYLYGKILKKQHYFSTARKYFEQSAKAGNACSMYELGKMFFIGKGCSQNSEESFTYFRISMENGYLKSDTFVNIFNSMNKKVKGFINLPPIPQYYFIKQIIKNGTQHKILMNSNQFRVLFLNHLFESTTFLYTLATFSELYIDVKYPSQLFEQEMNEIKNIKRKKIIGIKALLLIDGQYELTYRFGNDINNSIYNVTIESTVQAIKDYVFYNCIELVQVILPSSLIEIGEYAFGNCKSIEKITIPSSVTKIAITAFFGCLSLNTVSASANIINKLDVYGDCLFQGIEVKKNEIEACRLYKLAANGGFVISMNKYGLQLSSGRYIPQNKEEACRYYKMAADKGCIAAINNYGAMLSEGKGIEKNQEEACKYYKKAADHGYDIAMNNYAIMLENGYGITMNKEEASRYYKMAADNGNVKAMNKYGNILKKGEIIPKNEKEACRYFKMAMDKDDADAMYNYGIMLESGRGVATNKKDAYLLFKAAAKKSHTKGMFKYASLIENGTGVLTVMNKEEACKYYKLAAANDHIEAMYRYGNMLERGIGIKKNVKEACLYYKTAAEKGNTDAMYSYANMLLNGTGVVMNKKEACRYYKMAAEKGHIDAMNNYGNMLFNGTGVEKNDEEACRYFKMAADQGNASAMNSYANMLENGIGIEKNIKEAYRFYKMAADKGIKSAKFKCAFMLEKGIGTEKNDEKAFTYYKMSADEGNELAMFKCAVMLESGTGVKKDLRGAYRYYQFAAGKGHLDAMFKYGEMLENGIGVAKNQKEAYKYYQMAAEKGHVEAMNNYGNMLFNGIGVIANKKVASRYYKMAADHGHIDAMNNYGNMLFNGTGVEKNEKEACRYYKMAAEKGHIDAMNHYGNKLFNGTGVEKNEKEACRYFKMAADKGDSYAINNYGVMLKNGIGVEMNIKEAIRYYKMAIDKDNEVAMYNYGLMLQNGIEIEKNQEEACRYFKMSANKGYVDAIYEYALMLEKGTGIEMNKKEASRYYKMAADKGHESSMFNYAVMLENGTGIEKNEQEAIRYYKMAIDKGNTNAMLNYGNMLFSGISTSTNTTLNIPEIDFKVTLIIPSSKNKDEVKACHYYKMAADKGNADAMDKYGDMLSYGTGVLINIIEANRYYKMAADNGNVDSMYKLGVNLEIGFGILINKEEAIRYYKMAADKGHLKAQKNYQRLFNQQMQIQNLIDQQRIELMSIDQEIRHQNLLNKQLFDQIDQARNRINDLEKEINDFCDDINDYKYDPGIELPLSNDSNGIFSFLINLQKTPFDRLVVPSQSSGDIYCIIDPNSTDNYSSGSEDYEWIQFEFKEPIPVNSFKIKSAHRAFLRTWNFIAYDSNDKEIVLFQTKDDISLKKKYAEKTINFNSILSKKFRIKKLGMNWVGTNFMRIKNFELFSNDPQYSEGVFNTLLRNCGGDPHKAEVLITASNFDFQKFHNLSPSSYLSTLCDEDSPWFQVELCKGKAIVKGYRFQIVDNFPIHKWRFACSNDKESWDVIHESESPKIISSSIFVFETNSTKLYKYFRFINVSDNSEDDIKLKLRHFDIFGVYFSD